MMRLRGALRAAVALLAVAAFTASGADARQRAKHRHGPAHYEPSAHRAVNFPTYVDHGADRNPGGDNLYFTDTKDPHYIVGPAWFQRWE